MDIDPKRLLQWIGRTHDVLAAWFSFYLSYLFVAGYPALFDVPGIHEKALLFAMVAAACFYFSSLNRGTWRYASIPDLMAIVRGVSIAVLIYTVVLFLLSRGDNLPRSVVILTVLLSIATLSGSRLLYRILKEAGYLSSKSTRAGNPSRKVVLIGANANAENFFRAIKRADSSGFEVVGLVHSGADPAVKYQGMRVLGETFELPDLVDRYKLKGIEIAEAVLTDPQATPQDVSEAISLASEAGISLTRIPNLADTSVFSPTNITPKKVQIRDLLGRSEKDKRSPQTANFLRGKSVMITGAAGSIGTELGVQIARMEPSRLVLLDNSEPLLYELATFMEDGDFDFEHHCKIADVRDQGRMDALIAQHKPEFIFHAAALKQAPMMEDNAVECVKTNLLGTKTVADLALRHKVGTFVLISTDKATNPINVMGATKRAAEVYCQALDQLGNDTRFKSVRFGNVLGSNGSVVPRFEAQIAKGGPITVTHPDITRYFMTISEAVRLVLDASHNSIRNEADRGKIVLLDMGEPVKIVDMARKMIELAGLKPEKDIEISYTGLRKGEKLQEELFTAGEVDDHKDKNGFMVIAPKTMKLNKLQDVLARLEKAIANTDHRTVLSLLCEIVPEFEHAGSASEGGKTEENIVRLVR